MLGAAICLGLTAFAFALGLWDQRRYTVLQLRVGNRRLHIADDTTFEQLEAQLNDTRSSTSP